MDKELLETRKKRARIVVRELKKLFPEPEMALRHWKTNWELLVCVALSARTTDKQVNVVTEELFKKYTRLDDYIQATQKKFEQDIGSIGLYKSKAKNILAAARMLKDDFGGVVPQAIEDLVKLPGVGKKTANVVQNVAFGLTEGIAVDTHVHRLSRKFGLTSEDTPKKIEVDLMKILPKKEWRLITLRMIEYGREYSPAHKKGDCVISKKLKSKQL